MNSQKTSIILTSVLSAIFAGSGAANAALQLVIKNTDAVPGIGDVSWNTTNAFQSPSIDMSGRVGFRATLLTGGAVTSSNNSTMWYGAPGSLNLLARTGNQAPGLPTGINVLGFQSQNLPLSPNGNAWFGGTSTAPSGYIATGAPGSLTKVARNGDTLPGSATAISGNPASTSNFFNVNNAGQTLVSASAGVNTGVWVGNAATLHLAFITGQTYAGLPASPVRTYFGNSMNGNAQLLTNVGMTFDAGLAIDDTNNQVLATLPFGGSTFNPIARELDVAPGTGGAQYQRQVSAPPLNLENPAFTFGNGHFNNLGHVIYSSGLEGAAAGVTTSNNAAMFYYDGTSSHLFRRRGNAVSAIPGTTLAINSSAVNSARLNNNDTVAWSASLTQATGGVTSANDTVLLRSTLGSASDTLIAREGSGVGAVAGALWGSSFSNLMQNNAGQLVFSSTLLDDANDPNNNITTANDETLFSWDPTGGLSVIAREGDNLSSIGLNLTLGSSWMQIFNNANAEGGALAFTDNGWLTLRVTGTSLAGSTDTSGIVRLQVVPEPTTAALVFAAAPLLRRRRKA